MASIRPSSVPQPEPGSDIQVGVQGTNIVRVVGITGIPFQTITPPGPSTTGFLAFMDVTGTFLKWATANDLIQAGIGGDLLNKLTVDQQGLVMLDQQGNLVWSQ